MGGGKSSGGEIPPEIEGTAKILRDIGVEQFDLGLPLQKLGSQQGMDMLKTGQVGALMPAIRTGTEDMRATQSAQLQRGMENVTLQGLTGTALQEALAGQRMGAEQQVAAVPSQFSLPFLQSIGGPAMNLTEQGLGAIGQAGQIGGVSAGPARQSGGAAGALGGAASGAMMGAALGPVGMAAGAVLGGVMGSK